MEKEMNIISHEKAIFHAMTMEKKIIVTVLALVLPLWAIYETYHLLSSYSYYWIVILFVFAIIALHAYFWKKRTFSLLIVSQFLLAGGIVGTHVFLSMAKGIELLSGTQTGTFFSFPIQHGLINLKDVTIAGIVFLYSLIILPYFILKRREILVKKRSRKERKADAEKKMAEEEKTKEFIRRTAEQKLVVEKAASPQQAIQTTKNNTAKATPIEQKKAAETKVATNQPKTEKVTATIPPTHKTEPIKKEEPKIEDKKQADNKNATAKK